MCTENMRKTLLKPENVDNTMKIFGKICEDYHAVYTMHVEENMIRPVKMSEEMKKFADSEELNWEEVLEPMMKEYAMDDNLDRVLYILSREFIKTGFVDDNDYKERVYQQVSGRWLKMRVEPLEIKNGITSMALFTLKDVTEMHHQFAEAQELEKASETDILTGMYNRRKMEKDMKTIFHEQDSLSVIFFDINNLKNVNDKHGHIAGDRLIKLAARSFKSLKNDNVYSYRFGGDEFITIARNLDKEELHSLIQDWQGNLNRLAEETDQVCRVAYGIAHEESEYDIHEMLRFADREMYRNKAELKKIG